MKLLNIFNWVQSLVESFTFYGGAPSSGGGAMGGGRPNPMQQNQSFNQRFGMNQNMPQGQYGMPQKPMYQGMGLQTQQPQGSQLAGGFPAYNSQNQSPITTFSPIVGSGLDATNNMLGNKNPMANPPALGKPIGINPDGTPNWGTSNPISTGGIGQVYTGPTGMNPANFSGLGQPMPTGYGSTGQNPMNFSGLGQPMPNMYSAQGLMQNTSQY